MNAGEAERVRGRAVEQLLAGAYGRYAPALPAYVRSQPAPQALNALSALAEANGKADDALELARASLAADARRAEGQFALGRALKALQRYDEAAAAYECALELRPRYPEVLVSLGIVRRLQGRLEEAADAYRRALALRPDFPEALTNLGNVLADRLGRQVGTRVTAEELREAESVQRRALEVAPNHASAMHNLGVVLKLTGRYQEAAEWFNRALGQNSRRVDTCLEFAELLQREMRYDLARDLCSRWLEMHGTHPAVEIVLVESLAALGETEAALTRLEGIPTEGESQAAVKAGLRERIAQQKGEFDPSSEHALEVFRATIDARPEYFEAVCSYLLTLCYVEEDPAKLLAGHRARIAPVLARTIGAPAAAPAALRGPGERLRLGYLSPDFKTHSVAYFLAPILEAQDRSAFEVHLYKLNALSDPMTERLRTLADRWHECGALSDRQIAERMRADGIDILVDLGGLTSGARLGVVNLRPAPCQIGYLGYPTSTGATCFDFRISDAAIDPPGEDAYSAEPVLRLPQSMFCYGGGAMPEVATLPALAQGPITFGSFNNLAKAGGSTLRLWTEVLRAVPDSRLLLKSQVLSFHPNRLHLAQQFEAAGIAPERLVLQPFDPDIQRHLATYGQVDIGLDTYPYNGATTTCEALAMGVPVVSLAGRTHPSRMGASILGACGLQDFVAGDLAGYVERAAALAQDRDRLAALRAGLRPQLKASRLQDGAGFTRDFEAALRQAYSHVQGARHAVTAD